MADGEWQTVRRRRVTSTKPLKALPIPVVPLAFGALAVPDEAAELAREKRKKKRALSKKNKANRDQTNGDEDDDGLVDEDCQLDAAAKKQTQQQQVASSLPSLPALFNHLWSQLLMVLIWLQSLLSFGRGATRSKRHAKKPPKTAAAEAGRSSPAKGTVPTGAVDNAQTATAASAGSKASAFKTGPTAPTQPSQQQQKAPATSVAGPTRTQPSATEPAAAATPPNSQRHPAPVPATQRPQQQQQPTPAAVAAGTPQQPAAAEAMPAKKLSPAVVLADCDADWQAARFTLVDVPAAHAGVVASVAICGDLALSGGYDGALKLWHWAPGGAAGRPEASAPQRVKNLTGHTGNVEAVCASQDTMRAVSTGRDSALKVWDLDGANHGASAREAASYYVYESVRCMAVEWADQTALLGAKSGAVSQWSLENGRKLQVLKGHSDEVTVVRRSGGSLFSGSRDATVRVWDLRSSPGKQVAVLHGARGRVCSLDVHEHLLYMGDVSSSVKVFDLRALPAGATRATPPSYHVANAPAFAGDACPVAGLHVSGRDRVLVSSSIAWWTNNTKALEEAPADCTTPTALLNVFAAPASGAQPTYLYTARLGPGIVTCLAVHADRMLLGNAAGGLTALRLLRKGTHIRSGDGAPEAMQVVPVGVEEFSDDEGDDGDDEDADEESD